MNDFRPELKIMNILFVCSRNQWRSPTGEAIFSKSQVYKARSAGTADGARVKINARLMEWADIIFAMEQRHRDMLYTRFGAGKKVIVLDIPDEYGYMDEELIAMIHNAISPYLPYPV